MSNTIDVMNKFMVGRQGDRVVIMNPPRSMSPSDARLLAAYLVALAGEDDALPSFAQVLEAVQNGG